MRIGINMRRLTVFWAGLSVVALLAAGCAVPAPPVAPQSVGSVRTLEEPTPLPIEEPAGETPAQPEDASASDEAGPAPLPRGGEAMNESPDAVMARLSERAAEQAAKDANVAPDQVLVRVIERVEWNDASLGCPKPGRMYAQVITPGYRIVVEAGDQVIEYHTNMNPEGPLVRCNE